MLFEVTYLKQIILKTLSMKHENKTDKSIYNILIGKKTHQTYFDATIEHLKLYYGCLPNLKFEQFEQIINEPIEHIDEPIIGDFFYSQAIQSVNTILLLTQMISQKKHNHLTYQPIINDKEIQFKAKEIYVLIKEIGEDHFIEEIYQLFEDMNTYFQTIYIHYLLAGFRETPYTIEQISLIEEIGIMDLREHLVEEYQFIQVAIQNKERYPILSQINYQPLLNQQTFTTYELLNRTYDMDQLANIKRVKTHTIHDHIIEMYIKGYLNDKNLYISDDQYARFVEVIQQTPNQNLKFYYESLNDFTYFEIKLMYVCYAKEGLNATTRT